MSAQDDLTRLLADAYAARVLMKKSLPVVQAAFLEAARDPEFLRLARTELAAGDGIDAQRCFVTAKNCEFLRQMLAQVEASS